MAVPAGIYTLFNAGSEGAHGWGIPMATDIAFSLGVLTLLGRRVPFSLKVFLLALAIVDDLGAIVVIAVFYTESIDFEALAWGGLVLAAILALRRSGVRSTDVYVALGVLFWVAVLQSGIHATIAGVVLAMLTPASPLSSRREFDAIARDLVARYRAAADRGDSDAEGAVLKELERLTRDTAAPLDRLEHTLHPWVSYLIVPVFALANAGVVISGDTISAAAESRVTLGVLLGLVIGKPIGILLFSWLAVRAGLASMPANADYLHFVGIGLLAGIGFTVSLFITGLAFSDAELVPEAKMGILAASFVAGLAGFVYLWFAPGEPEPGHGTSALADATE
jgi:NhaA family Na+:H+ antiporter